MRRSCGVCSYFQIIDGTGGNIGYCLCEPPKPFPAVAPPTLAGMGGRPQLNVQGIDPPVKSDRRACRHFEPDIADA
jgi:hypothetical protein